MTPKPTLGGSNDPTLSKYQFGVQIPQKFDLFYRGENRILDHTYVKAIKGKGHNFFPINNKSNIQ